MKRISTGSRRGFGTLEVILGVLLLASVAMLVSMTYMRGQQASQNVRRLNQSRALADMAFEQYWANASTATLRGFDRLQPITVGAFFGTGADDLGYSDFRLASRADCPAGGLLCDIHVTVSWLGASVTRSQEYVRSFTTLNGPRDGGTVFAWVKEPCGEVDPDLIVKNCPGIPGFEVRASSSVIPNHLNILNTGEVLAYTDSNGRAILRNVPMGPGLTVLARKPGSHVTQSASGFIQGYYTRTSALPSTIDSRTVNVPPFQPGRVIFQDFLPLGKITGHLTNASGGSERNMIVVASATASTGRGVRANPRWSVLTDASGNYEFSNVYPGNVMIYAAGDPGSHPTVRPEDGAKFRWGYTNRNPYSVTLPVPASAGTPSSAVQNVTVQRMGWLRMELLRPDATRVEGAVFATRLPPTFFRRSAPVTMTVPGAVASLFNVFDMNRTTMTFTAWGYKPPPGFPFGDNDYHVSNLEALCDLGQENLVSLHGAVSYKIEANLVRNPAGVKLNGFFLSPTGLAAPRDNSGTVVAADGSWRGVHFFRPTYSATPDLSRVAFTWAYSPRRFTAMDADGQVVDVLTGEGIGNATVTFFSDNNSRTALTAADGRFTLTGGMIPVEGSLTVPYSCAGNPCLPNNGPGEIVIDTTTINVELVAAKAGYQAMMTVRPLVRPPATPANILMPVSLVKYRVAGTVTEAGTGSGLKGIKVCDAGYNLSGTPSRFFPPSCATTLSDGSYSLMATVVDRGPDAGGVLVGGSVSVYIPENSTAGNGSAYEGGPTQSVPVPLFSADPVAGVSVSFALRPLSGSL
jgi:hypothetical protein